MPTLASVLFIDETELYFFSLLFSCGAFGPCFRVDDISGNDCFQYNVSKGGVRDYVEERSNVGKV